MVVLLLVFKIFLAYKLAIYIWYRVNYWLNTSDNVRIKWSELVQGYRKDPTAWTFDNSLLYNDYSFFRHLQYKEEYVFYVDLITYERLKFYARIQKYKKIKDREAKILQEVLRGD